MDVGGYGGGGSGMAAMKSSLTKKLAYATRIYQHYLDKTNPYAVPRWIGTFIIAVFYALRILYVQGFYVVTYALSIYLFNLLIGFLSPLVDPEVEGSDGTMLPTKGSDEFKPFISRLPDFKFWKYEGGGSTVSERI